MPRHWNDLSPEAKQEFAQVLSNIADGLAATAGSAVGGRLGGAGGAAIGRAVAPELIEAGALGIHRQVKKRRSPKSRARGKLQSKAMKKVQSRARTKKGKLRKGWDQSRIMREMHKECRRMMKR